LPNESAGVSKPWRASKNQLDLEVSKRTPSHVIRLRDEIVQYSLDRRREVAMGLLWRLFAPRGLKRARRKIRRAAHPVRTASWALSPKRVKRARRAAFKVTNPGEALEWAVSDQIVRSVRNGKGRRRRR
jgi:hypothetical protein